MRQLWLSISCACILVLASVLDAQTLPADPPPIVEGSMMHTARGGGRWQTFFNAHSAGIRAANRDSIWFGTGENLWRYNVTKKTLDAYVTPLTHPNIRLTPTLALSDQGSLAMACNAVIYLWTPKEGWSRVPQVAAATNDHFPAFDSKGNLFVSNYQGFYRWSNGYWEEVKKLNLGREVPLAPVGDGWVNLKDPGWYNNTLADKRLYTQGLGRNPQRAGFFRVNGHAFGFTWSPPEGQSWDNIVLNLFRFTPEAAEPLASGMLLGLDLAGGEGFRVIPDGDRKQATIESLAGKNLARIPLPPDFPTKALLLRDSNGDYWVGAKRFDGHTWQSVLPAWAFDYAGDMQEGILTGRLQYDPQKLTWIDTTPELPAGVKEFDPKTRAGWLKREKNPGSNERTVWDHIAFAPDGSPKTIESVPVNDRGYYFCTPRFQDKQGNCWFRGRWRWDGKTGHVYDEGFETRNMKENIVPPEFVLADSGTVWQFKMNRTWGRYNLEADLFEPGEPYDDFAFTLGGRTFSITARTRDRDFEEAPFRLFEKRNGKWETFATPFWVGSGLANASCFASGLPGVMVHDSRMLVATQGGIFEWDAKRNVWAYLMPRGQYWACFDAQGRRIMSGDKIFNQILMYEGDPTSPGMDLGEKLDLALSRIIKDLDDDSWRRRDEATRDLTNLLRQHPKDIIQLLTTQAANPALSAEVRNRIGVVLAEKPPAAATSTPGGSWYEDYQFNLHSRLGNSLFERMVQPLNPSFPGGYIVRLGMRFDLAESIFAAAGAQSSPAVHNQFYPDQSYRGYILRDNTMVYLRIDAKAAAPTITQIGMGPFGKGFDKDWPWNDPKPNALKTLELNAAPATQPSK